MQIPLEDFDLSVYDSADINLATPEWMLSKLLMVLEALTDTSPNAVPEKNTEIKLRAVLNTLIHEGLRLHAWSKAQFDDAISFPLPKLGDIVVECKGDLDVVRFQNKLVILAPRLAGSSGVVAFISWLNSLVDYDHAARTWILDLSLVEEIPFELFGFLIGLKQTLNRLNIGLDLLWLRRDAVPIELLNSVQKNFNLYKKGSFLLSRDQTSIAAG